MSIKQHEIADLLTGAQGKIKVLLAQSKDGFLWAVINTKTEGVDVVFEPDGMLETKTQTIHMGMQGFVQMFMLLDGAQNLCEGIQNFLIARGH